MLPFCRFLDCAVYLGLIEPEDLGKLVNGDIEEGGDEEDELCIKITLELLNLLTTMYSVRKEGTESAMKYLFTNSRNNDFDGQLVTNTGGLKRKSTFSVETGESSGAKSKKLDVKVVNKGCSKVDTFITSESTIDDYDLGAFDISENGVISFDGGLIFD